MIESRSQRYALSQLSVQPFQLRRDLRRPQLQKLCVMEEFRAVPIKLRRMRFSLVRRISKPLIQIRLKRKHRAAVSTAGPAHREAQFSFPALNRPDAPSEIGSNLFPGIQYFTVHCNSLRCLKYTPLLFIPAFLGVKRRLQFSRRLWKSAAKSGNFAPFPALILARRKFVLRHLLGQFPADICCCCPSTCPWADACRRREYQWNRKSCSSFRPHRRCRCAPEAPSHRRIAVHGGAPPRCRVQAM